MLRVGDKFSSYEEFQSKLKEYERTVFTNYWTRDCATLKKKFFKHPQGIAGRASPKVKYYSLRLSCIKGGRHQARKEGRRRSLTFKQGCEAGMYLKVSKCGQFLELVELNEEHNHIRSEALFRALPNQANKPMKAVKKRLSQRQLSLLRKSYKHKIQLNSQDEVKTKNDPPSTSKTSSSKQKLIQKHDKIKIMNETCFKLSKICSNASIDVFQERLNIIRDLVHEWSNHNEVNEDADEEARKETVEPNPSENNYMHILDIRKTPLTITNSMEICEIPDET